MEAKFLGKKLLFLIAHPDDESFAAAGTMFKNFLAGGQNYIVCATLGERGKSHMGRSVTQKELRKIRKNELIKVAEFLKVSGLYFFKFPDAGLKAHGRDLEAKTKKLAKKIKPDYIFSFGPDGMSGHLDHIAAGKAARQVSKKLGIPFVAFAASPGLVKRFKGIKSRRAYGKYAKTVTHRAPNLKVKIDFKNKLKVLSFHKSQFGQSTMLADVPKQVKDGFMDYEYFVV